MYYVVENNISTIILLQVYESFMIIRGDGNSSEMKQKWWYVSVSYNPESN